MDTNLNLASGLYLLHPQQASSINTKNLRATILKYTMMKSPMTPMLFVAAGIKKKKVIKQ